MFEPALIIEYSCLQFDNNSAQHLIIGSLADLKRSLIELKASIEPGGAYNMTATLPLADRRVAQNFQRLVREAESFHSSRSTIAGSTVWGGSIMGDPLP